MQSFHLTAKCRTGGRDRYRLTVHLTPKSRSAPGLQGPLARIVTLSRDTLHRDFTLAQEGRTLVFRVRTPAIGPVGMQPSARSFGAALEPEAQRVSAVFDGTESRLFLEGRCVGDAWVALARAREPFAKLIALVVACCAALFALALCRAVHLWLAPRGSAR